MFGFLYIFSIISLSMFVAWSTSLSSGGETSREVAKRPGIETSKGAKRPGGELAK